MKIVPVVLSGGTGTRLWPLSRKQYPKQYLPLIEEQTMLQATIRRLNGLQNLTDPIVICNIEHRFLVAEQLHEIGMKNPVIILEPVGKNTAPAIAIAGHYINKYFSKDTDYQMLVLPADHIVQDVIEFHKAINIASVEAQNGKLITFGIAPSYPHTGYGYIKVENVQLSPGGEVENIKGFKEKPSKVTAEEYIKNGNYLWNSGMFLFQVNTLIEELSIHASDILEITKQSIENAIFDLDFVRIEDQSFLKINSESIDYALMEKTKRAVVISLDVGWNDVGSWAALHEVGEKDPSNNVINGDVLAIDTSNSYIHADHHMITTIGVDNLVIIDTADATLVTIKEKAQQVKDIVERLQKEDRCEEQLHRKVYRPWGSYDTIDKESRFQVKRISVNPGASLSLQKHYHRAEHWIVVRGTARVTIGNKTELLHENESTYIPIGALHRLENPNKSVLEMIEVQSGEYLGEDDIVRYEDSYGRD